MTSADIAAYLGAAAWLPQIFSWIRDAATKAEVTVLPHRTPEIGFTTFGPIVNLSCALLSSRKDAIVNSMRLTAKHEKGREYSFEWSGLSEFTSQIPGTGQGIGKAAIALKISNADLVEKKIGFQDLDFQRNANQFLAATRTQATYLKNAGQAKENVTKSKEFNDLLNYFRYAPPWEQGRYSVTLSIFLVGEKSPREFAYSFVLPESDTQRLRGNVTEIEKYLSDIFLGTIPADGKYGWYWAYPNLDATQDPEPKK